MLLTESRAQTSEHLAFSGALASTHHHSLTALGSGSGGCEVKGPKLCGELCGGPGRGSERGRGVGPPARRGRGEGLHQHSRGPVPPPSLQTAAARDCGGSPRGRRLEGPAPRDPQAGLCLAHAHPNSTGSKAGSGCVSAPPGHCPRRGHTYHTHAHTARSRSRDRMHY